MGCKVESPRMKETLSWESPVELMTTELRGKF